MTNLSKFEKDIVPTTWEDSDNDHIVQSKIDDELGLESKDELDV